MVQNAVVVLGVLKIVLGHDPIAKRVGIPREGLVLLVDLAGVPPDLDVGAVAVEALGPALRRTSPRIGAMVAWAF
jgi:hypothetical protein